MTNYRPLEGVRVLSFETAASLPAGTRTLADLGADVVRVAEPASVVSPYIRIFDTTLVNKRSLALDLKTPGGRALALRLAAVADVVSCNFRPSVLQRFGLDYDALRAVNDDIIVLQLSGYGTPGPWQDFPAYGPSVEAAGGMNSMMGMADERPQRVGGGVFADTLAGRYAAIGILGALLRRDLTGEGQYVDASMYECIVTGLGGAILRAGVEGRAPERRGNRDERFAPQGVYRTAGGDQWVAISVTTDEEWQALVDLVGSEALRDPALSEVAGRQAAHDRIDEVIERWTSDRDRHEVAEALQSHGVPAAAVAWPGDVPADPQMQARGAFRYVDHHRPILGYSRHPHLSMPALVEGYERAPVSDHVDEGSCADEVLEEWLGATEDELTAWRAEGALLPTRPLLPPDSPAPEWFGARSAPRDERFAEKLGLADAMAREA